MAFKELFIHNKIKELFCQDVRDIRPVAIGSERSRWIWNILPGFYRGVPRGRVRQPRRRRLGRAGMRGPEAVSSKCRYKQIGSSVALDIQL